MSTVDFGWGGHVVTFEVSKKCKSERDVKAQSAQIKEIY